MSDDNELKARMAAAAAVQLQVVIEEARATADEIERVTGYRVMSPERPSITDATRADLQRMLDQVKAGERALTLALGWIATGTLGNVMKVMPEDAADELRFALVAAGLLAPES